MQLPMKPLAKTARPAWNRMPSGIQQDETRNPVHFFNSSAILPRFFSVAFLNFSCCFPVPGCSFGYSGLFRQPAHGAARVTARFLLDDFQQLSDIFVHGFPG